VRLSSLALVAVLALIAACIDKGPDPASSEQSEPKQSAAEVKNVAGSGAPAAASSVAGSAATVAPKSLPSASSAAMALANIAGAASAGLSVDENGLPVIERLPDPRTIPDSPKGLVNGDFAPELAHRDLVSAQPFALSTLVGPQAAQPRGAVVVSFTASWCGPCRASLPYLKDMEERYPQLDVVLVSLDEDQAGRDKELRQLRASGLQAPLLLPDEDSRRAWLGRKRNIPHLYIINAAGEVLVQDRGFGNKVRRVLPKQIGYAIRNPGYVVRARKVR
tara:strand:- start:1441 stop:2271 length:831 start_codon:yes stop_codon:yes gene_type:complete